MSQGMVGATDGKAVAEANTVRRTAKDELYFCPEGNVASPMTRQDFSPEQRNALKALHRLDKRWNWVVPLHFAIWLGAAWLSISSGSLAVSIVGYLIAGLSLSTLSVLGHEASHNLFTRNPKIDRWIGFLVGTPVVFSASGYRIMHPLHHKYVRDAGDPDNIENITTSSFWLRWLYVFVFFLAVYLYLVLVPINAVINAKKNGDRMLVLLEWLAMIGIVALGWALLPSSWMVEGWLLPLIVAGQVANVRGIAEHGMTTSGNELTDTRTVTTTPVLSFLICNINYHLEHHLYPGIPWYNLPRAHRILRENYRMAGSSVYTSYLTFLADFFKAVVHGVVSERRLVPAHIREHVCV
ncbi:MAG: fatty acid desaturase [Gemmatimonadota bacterium]|nr:fatty acid desaturase [Gemmatimonadota bacterium]